jgi:hypothetical protein
MASTAAVSFAVADQFDDNRALTVLNTPPGAGVAPGAPSPGQAPGLRSNDVTGTIVLADGTELDVLLDPSLTVTLIQVDD